MRRLILAVLLATACAFNQVPQRDFVDGDDIADLEEDAALVLRCPETDIQSRELSLFERLVTGCGREARYAWDQARDRWVLEP
jgi:hypothetical protein